MKKGFHLSISFKKMDKDTFKLLYKEFYKTVFNHLYFNSNNYELSRDLAQETFFKLWEQRNNIKDPNTLIPYLLKISRNLLLDYYRHKGVEQKYIDAEIINGEKTENVEAQVNASILEEKIRAIVKDKLSPKSQAIFIMSRFEGKSNDEISEVFGLSKKTIENELYKISVLLKENLKHFL